MRSVGDAMWRRCDMVLILHDDNDFLTVLLLVSLRVSTCVLSFFFVAFRSWSLSSFKKWSSFTWFWDLLTSSLVLICSGHCLSASWVRKRNTRWEKWWKKEKRGRYRREISWCLLLLLWCQELLDLMLRPLLLPSSCLVLEACLLGFGAEGGDLRRMRVLAIVLTLTMVEFTLQHRNLSIFVV